MAFKKFKAHIVKSSRRNSKYNSSDTYILLQDVIDESGNTFRDHTWIKETKRIKNILGSKVNENCIIEFTACVNMYPSISSYQKEGLKHIRNIKKVENHDLVVVESSWN